MELTIKKIISAFLVLCLVVSLVIYLPMLKTRAAANPVSSGKFIVDMVSDPVTSIPSTFGSASDAGRVWVDKSVGTKTDGTFNIDLSVLGQEYINVYEAQTSGSASSNALQADVVFVLDMSTSMGSNTDIDSYTVNASGTYYKDDNGNYITPIPSGFSGTRYSLTKITRLKAMVDATNNAIGIIMASNPKNRVGVYWFGGAVTSTHVGTFMSMGAYTLASGTSYLDLSGTTVSTNTNLQKDGSAYSRVSVTTGAGTPTQDGIVYGIQSAVADISAKTSSAGFSTYGKRQPFVFLLSDGAASIGNATWWTTPSNPTNVTTYNTSSGSLSGSTTYGSQTVAAATILSASYQKSLITSAYKSYNQAGGVSTDYPALFYSVGLGPNTAINLNGTSETADTSTNYAWCGLNPGGLIANFSYNGSVINKPTSPSATNTKSQIATYISSAQSAGFADYANYSITGTPGFVYSKYYFYAPSYPDLSLAFTQLSSDVANATKSVVLPVESYSGDSVTTVNGSNPVVVISDKLGDAMSLNGVPVIDSTTGVQDIVSSTPTKTVYTFANYDAYAEIENGVITFYIYPNDFMKHMYSFSDSSNPVEGEYTSALPFKLSYTVKPVAIDTEVSLHYYSNAFIDQAGTKTSQTVATYRPAISNPYYYYTNSYVGLVGGLNAVGQKAGGVSGVKDSDITHYVKGTAVSDITSFASTGLNNVYVTYAMANVVNSPVTQSQIGTLIHINGADIAGYSTEYKTELNKTIYGCMAATSADTDSVNTNFAYQSGIVRSTYSVVAKTENVTDTANYSSENTFEDGALTTKLGNNGKISVIVGINKGNVSGTAGSTQEYITTVTNYTNSQLTGITVHDNSAFSGTATDTTESSVGASFSQTGTDISWDSISIPANDTTTLSYTLKIPSDATEGTEVNKDATLTFQGKDAVSAGKTTVTELVVSTVSVGVKKDDSAWPEFTGVITLKDTLGNIITADNFDQVPDGEYTIYVDNIATNVTFTVDVSSSTSYSPVLNYYTLTIAKGTGIDSVSGGGIYLSGATASGISALPLSGYSFTKWSSSDAAVFADNTTNSLSLTMPAKSLTLTAEAEANDYSVAFDANGGTYSDFTAPDTSVKKTIAQTYNEHYVFPQNPTRTGYTFGGWNTNNTGTGDAVSVSSIVNITTSSTLYAVWTELDAVRINYVSQSTLMGDVTPAHEDLNPETGNPTGSTATPKTGYQFVKWMDGNGTTVSTSASFVPAKGSGGKYTNATYTAVFEKIEHTIKATANPNGSISPSGDSVVDYGDDKTYTFTPNTGYHVVGVLVDGAANAQAVAAGSYTFEDVSANHTIVVTFAINSYTLTPTAGANGSISPNTVKTVDYGGNQTFTFTPAAGYHIDTVKVDGTANAQAVSAGQYSFTNVSANHTIEVTFAMNTYTITPTAGVNGSISPNTVKTVNYGGNQTFTFTPATGYHIDTVKVDGTANAQAVSAAQYTFTNVSANHTIEVTFGMNTFTITPAAGANGSISPSTVQTVNSGANQTFTFTPAAGYKVKNVLVDNASVGTPSGYTFSNISANHTVSVEFEKMKYNIRSTAGANGSISPLGDIAVEYGDSKTYTFTPAQNAFISSVKIDGVANTQAVAAGSYTFANVSTNHTIEVAFGINSYKITPSAGANGSIYPNSVQSANYGDSQTYSFTPAAGYRIKDVLVDGESVGTPESYTFTSITANHTIDVQFEMAQFIIHSITGENGSITPLGQTVVGYGDGKTYSFIIKKGYHIADVKIDGVSDAQAVMDGSYTFENVSDNHTIEVTYSKDTYTVFPSAGENGSISPDKNQTTSYGDAQTYTFTPNDGYKIKDVLVDGVSIGTPDRYTFSNINANHTVRVVFEKIPSNPSAPDTGDKFSILAYIFLILLSVTTLGYILKKKRA